MMMMMMMDPQWEASKKRHSWSLKIGIQFLLLSCVHFWSHETRRCWLTGIQELLKRLTWRTFCLEIHGVCWNVLEVWRSSGRTHRNWCALIFEAALGPKLTCFVALKVCEAFINSKVSIDAKDTDSWPCGDVYLFLDHLFVAPGNEQICPGFCIWSALGFFQGCWAKAAGNFLKWAVECEVLGNWGWKCLVPLSTARKAEYVEVKSLVILIQDMFLARRRLLSLLNLFGFWDFNQLSGPHRLLVTEFVQDGELFQQVERFAILECRLQFGRFFQEKKPTWNHRVRFVQFSTCCFLSMIKPPQMKKRWELMPRGYHCGLAGFSSQRG